MRALRHGPDDATAPRIDVFVRVAEDNAKKLESVLPEFGFASPNVTAEDFLKPGMILQMGVEPYRIDVITSITGVEFF